MGEPLETWDRPDFTVGGGKPYLFYVVFGAVDTGAPLSASTYRTAGIPGGVTIAGYTAAEHPEVINGFREGYVWDTFRASHPDLADHVADCDQCLVIRGEPENDSDLNYLRDTVGLLAWMLDNGGIALYDPFRIQWWEPEQWKQETHEPGEPLPLQHTIILFSAEDDDPSQTWFHTRGMLKFGRPDISVHDVATKHKDAVIELCNRLIEHQASGAVIPEGEPVQMKTLPQGATLHHGGHMEDPDFNNVHVELRWP